MPVKLSPQIRSETFPNLTRSQQDIIINEHTSSRKVHVISIGF